MGTQNNLFCGLREIFITNMNISVKMIIAKYDHYLHGEIGCSCKLPLNFLTSAVKPILKFFFFFLFFVTMKRFLFRFLTVVHLYFKGSRIGPLRFVMIIYALASSSRIG